MDSSQKFRSIQAFRDYEQKQKSSKRSASFSIEVEDVSPLTVMSLLKRSPEGLERQEIAEKLNADLKAVEEAVLALLREDVARIEPGETPEKDRIVS